MQNAITPTELFLPVRSYATTLCVVKPRCSAVSMREALTQSTR